MKKTSLFISACLALLLFFGTTENGFAQGKSQKKEKTNVKKENGPPPWAPAHGYRAKTRYVYFTEQNFYYDNTRGVYIYLSGKNWEVSASIPNIFKNVDLSAAVKIDIDLESDDPQKYNAEHKKKYKKG
jgi:hypothetical protein